MKHIIFLLVLVNLANYSFSQKFEVDGHTLEIIDEIDLEIPYVRQTQQNWCWAACAAMVINFYEETNLNSCQVASKEFNYNCCNNPRPCDKQNSLDRFKFMVYEYDIDAYPFEEKISWEAIKNHLDNEETMIIRVESNYGGHFLVVTGYYIQYNHTTGTTARMINIHDPYLIFDRNVGEITGHRMSYETLLNGFGYEYKFVWTHTLRFKYWDN